LCALVGALILLLLMPGGARQAPASGVVEAPPEPTEAPATLSDLAAKWSGSVAEVEVEYQVGRRSRTTEQGNGSGVYVDPRGFFLTNYHVIEDTLGVRVRLPDGRALEVLGSAYDRTYDVAMLYTGPVEALAAVEVGASGVLRVGDPVFAIGYPRVGDDVLPGTLTAGVVSGLNRKDVTAGNISPDVGMIQIDAAINAGNSGGALFDMDGMLVGIPAMKIAAGYGEESFEGLAFAIPIDVARPIAVRLMDEIIQKGNGQ
jgi:S1-C subfamily serine protease